jgi:hypothetical protein
VALSSNALKEGIYQKVPPEERWQLLVNDIREGNITVGHTLQQQHIDLILDHKHCVELESLDFFTREIFPALRLSELSKQEQVRASKGDSAFEAQKKKEPLIEKEVFLKDFNSKYKAPELQNVQQKFDSSKFRGKQGQEYDFTSNHDALDDFLLFFEIPSYSFGLKRFCPVTVSLELSRRRKENANAAATAEIKGSTSGSQVDNVFMIHNQKFSIDTSNRVYLLSQNLSSVTQKVFIQHEDEKFAVWSFRHLRSILEHQAEQTFENLSIDDSRLFEAKYKFNRDSVFDFSFPSCQQDACIDASAKDLGRNELWSVSLNSLSARRSTSHQLMYPDMELKRQEIVWAYEVVRDDQKYWCSTSFHEAAQLEKHYRSSGFDTLLLPFKFDSFLFYALNGDDPRKDWELIVSSGDNFIKACIPDHTRNPKIIYRFPCEAVQGDVVCQCSQWLYFLEQHFTFNEDSYCYAEPSPQRMLEQVWQSLATINSSLNVHKGCRSQCDPKEHYTSLQSDIFVHMSPAVLCVARTGIRELHYLLCNPKPGRDIEQYFTSKTWRCFECYTSEENRSETSSLRPSTASPFPLLEHDAVFHDIDAADPPPSPKCMCPVICRWALAVSSWHDDEKHRNPHKLDWWACCLNRLPFPDGFEQIAKIFCTAYKGFDLKFMKDIDTANLMNIFIYCRYFQFENFGLAIPKTLTKQAKELRNGLVAHTRSEETCLQISCEVYQSSVNEAFKFVSQLARLIFVRKKEHLMQFLLSQWIKVRQKFAANSQNFRDAHDDLFKPNGGVYDTSHPAYEILQMNNASFRLFLDVEPLSSIRPDCIEIIKGHLDRQRSVRLFFAKECKDFRQQACKISNNFMLLKKGHDIDLFVKIVNSVISSTAEMSLIADFLVQFDDL